MKVLVACEESQAVCIAFRELGHEAYSCDIQECSGGHPEWHIQCDALKSIEGGQVTTMDGRTHDVGKWDLLIAHPPCTYLTVTGNRWFNVIRYGEAAQKRWDSRCHAIVFFLMFAFAECERIAIENPVGCMSRYFRKPDQITQPYDFGDPFEKKTCWWLKGLPKLQPTDVVTPPPRQVLSSGKTMPRWYSNCGGNRAKARSVTFPGIAKAMAEQWGGLCE